MYIILDNKKRQRKLKKQFSGVPLNAILPIIGVWNKAKFSFKKAELERLVDSGDELYNVASNTAY
jgi:hypothetical protein